MNLLRSEFYSGIRIVKRTYEWPVLLGLRCWKWTTLYCLPNVDRTTFWY